MAHLIDKDALVAEIERKADIICQGVLSEEATISVEYFKDSLISFLDSLEVKEMDLEEELRQHLKDCLNVKFPTTDVELIKKDVEYTARKFFELGTKAQHDNWKVIDNLNLPQPDKNKIYCVLSKNKYLLAKVREHPHDELLQWKCTEFPFHCYDMCEGDKYMQIV